MKAMKSATAFGRGGIKGTINGVVNFDLETYYSNTIIATFGIGARAWQTKQVNGNISS